MLCVHFRISLIFSICSVFFAQKFIRPYFLRKREKLRDSACRVGKRVKKNAKNCDNKHLQATKVYIMIQKWTKVLKYSKTDRIIVVFSICIVNTSIYTLRWEKQVNWNGVKKCWFNLVFNSAIDFCLDPCFMTFDCRYRFDVYIFCRYFVHISFKFFHFIVVDLIPRVHKKPIYKLVDNGNSCQNAESSQKRWTVV